MTSATAAALVAAAAGVHGAFVFGLVVGFGLGGALAAACCLIRRSAQ